MQKTTTSRLLNRGGIADLPLLRTLLTIRQKVPRAKFLESDGLFCVISICKFGSFRNPFAMVTSLSELYFRFRRFILLVQTKKVISMNYGSSTSSWKPWRWVRLDLMRDIYIWTHSQNSLASAEALSLEISCHGTSLKWSRRLSQSAVKRGIPLWIWWKVNGNWDKNNIRISKRRESHCRTTNSVRRKKYIQNSRTVRITVWDPSKKVNHLNKFVWDRKIITEFTRSISSNRIGKPVLMIDVKVSKDKHKADGLIERTSSMLHEIESKTVHKDVKSHWWRKKK